MTLYKWSQTAASNGTADSTCPFPEGMAPSAINDGTRGMMAAVAKYRDDQSGQIVTTGTLNAYVVSSFQAFDSLADMHGKEVWFTPHVTNGATVTLNVDSLGAKPLRLAPGVELPSSTIILGTPYGALYNNTDGAWYLKGTFASPFNVPLFGGMDFWDTVAPSSAFIFPTTGLTLSRSVYAAVFARWGTKYGAGDGSTTFGVPPVAGKTRAMIEASASLLTSTYFGADSTQIGSVGGSDHNSVLLTHNHGITDPGHAHTEQYSASGGSSGYIVFSNGSGVLGTGANIPTQSATTGITVNNAGSASGHNIVQPTITCNYVIRVL